MMADTLCMCRDQLTKSAYCYAQQVTCFRTWPIMGSGKKYSSTVAALDSSLMYMLRIKQGV